MSSTAPSRAEPVLVATKLHVPLLRPGTVTRRELIDLLVGGADRKLTLVCAPAGWGKTFLLSEWHASARENRAFAWVSLDPIDDDPVRFWSYFIGAVQTVAPDVGSSALAILPNVGPGLIDVVLARLINELEKLPQPFVLVLDDYHVVHDELIHGSVEYLLRHLPRTMQLAIATRADPPLPLGRFRAAGDVLELRAAELRFSESEADELLNGVLELALDAADVGLLQGRTEGWAAGLQLAAMSLRDRDDRSAFVRAFAGDDRQIGEYLDEVLEGHDRALREFLVRTSILDRLCAALCDAVTGDTGSDDMLREAYRSNLFLVALDERGRWYRCHHLLRELLHGELVRGDPEFVAELHRRAFEWHHAAGDVENAIAHATAAGANDEAADLIARNWRTAWAANPRAVGRWIDALPSSVVEGDPRLCLARSWTALFLGDLDGVERWSDAAERSAPPGSIVEGAGPLELSVSTLRSPLALHRGDVGRAQAAARGAVSLAGRTPSPGGWIAAMFLGLSSYFAGDLDAAIESLEGLRGSIRELTSPQTVLTTLAALAACRAQRGEYEPTERLLGEAARTIDEFGLDASPPVSLVHVARGKLLEARGDLAGADAEYSHAIELTRSNGWQLHRAHALLLRAVAQRRLHEVATARSLTREVRQALAECPDPGMVGEQLARTEKSLQLVSSSRREASLAPDPELSEREIVILRLLASDLSQREIGSELYVSLNTVKTHTRNVFRKLGVATRADAVARGRELGLI